MVKMKKYQKILNADLFEILKTNKCEGKIL